MKIKALSLWQPWASLIAVGAKKYETRSWATSYRGPLLICAAKRIMDPHSWGITSVAVGLGYFGGNINNVDLPLGKAVTVAYLTNCEKLFLNYNCVLNGEDFSKIPRDERFFGDFSPGRYAWKLENVRAIEPFPVKGRQGLFEVEVPEELLTNPSPLG